MHSADLCSKKARNCPDRTYRKFMFGLKLASRVQSVALCHLTHSRQTAVWTPAALLVTTTSVITAVLRLPSFILYPTNAEVSTFLHCL